VSVLDVQPRDGGRGALLAVRAQPGARRAGVLGTWNGHLKIGLHSPPEGGRANQELVDLVARLVGLRSSQVSLVRGPRSRTKVLALDAPPRLVLERLLALLPAAE